MGHAELLPLAHRVPLNFLSLIPITMKTKPQPAPGIRFRLRRERLGSGGACWGIGSPLYHASSEDGEIVYFLRASNRTEAREAVAARYPGARFFR